MRWLVRLVGEAVVRFRWLFGLAEAYLPKAVAAILSHHQLADELFIRLVQVGQYANLTNEQRREYARHEFESFLVAKGIHLPEREVNLLLELVFGRVKNEDVKLAPPPLDWTRPKTPVG